MPFRTTIYLNFTTDLQEKLAAANMPIAIRTESNVLAQALIGFRADRALPPHSLFPLPPADPHGRQRRAQFRQIESAHAGARQEQDHLQGRRGRRRGERRSAGAGRVPARPEEIPETRRPHSEGRACSSAPRAPARRCSRAPSRAKRTCRSSPSAAPILWKCLSASARAGCATCLSRARNPRPALFSSMKSTRSAAIADTASAVVTTSASRRSMRSLSRWMVSTRRKA